jgi:hypothetical protein
MVGLAVTAMLGFEEPNNTLLLFSSVLIFAATVAMLVHLDRYQGADAAREARLDSPTRRSSRGTGLLIVPH